jgi:hypothetical protein
MNMLCLNPCKRCFKIEAWPTRAALALRERISVRPKKKDPDFLDGTFQTIRHEDWMMLCTDSLSHVRHNTITQKVLLTATLHQFSMFIEDASVVEASIIDDGRGDHDKDDDFVSNPPPTIRAPAVIEVPSLEHVTKRRIGSRRRRKSTV